ncbi:transposase [Roseovarius sp. MBR-78]|uniref:IS110 family transposase n=1 Tax=Roseovarius sp. MBR-78 TaxID=3156460 RepID=UPI0033984611
MTITQNISFVGIDVGKHDLVLARHDAPNVQSYSNTAPGIAALTAELGGGKAPVQVALEATGGYEWPLWEALHAAGIPVRQVPPAQVRAFARSRGQRAKTDRTDAQTIAGFAAFRPEAGRRLGPKSVRELKLLVTARRQRVTDRKRVQTRSQRTGCETLAQLDQALLDLLKAQIADLDRQITNQIAACPQLSRAARLLRSIPGIGPVMTATLLAEMPELGTLCGKAAAALTGLAPIARDSGTFKGQRFIGGGRKPVRDVAFMAASVALKHNPDLAVFFQRLRGRGMPHKKAICATARKLILLANTVLKRDTPWQPNPPS